MFLNLVWKYAICTIKHHTDFTLSYQIQKHLDPFAGGLLIYMCICVCMTCVLCVYATYLCVYVSMCLYVYVSMRLCVYQSGIILLSTARTRWHVCLATCAKPHFIFFSSCTDRRLNGRPWGTWISHGITLYIQLIKLQECK